MVTIVGRLVAKGVVGLILGVGVLFLVLWLGRPRAAEDGGSLYLPAVIRPLSVYWSYHYPSLKAFEFHRVRSAARLSNS